MKTHLNQILTITGEPGLFKAIFFNKRGVLVESIDDRRVQTLKTIERNQIACLVDISIYSINDSETIPLHEIFAHMYNKAKKGIELEVISNKKTLKELLRDIVPTYDPLRVKDHEIKKIAIWYNTLLKYYPEIFQFNSAL